MKGLITALAIATALVVATPASAHTWGGNAYLGGTNPGTSYVTYDEASYAANVALQWVEGKNTLRWSPVYRINSQLVRVGMRMTDYSLFRCDVGWNGSYAGPTPHGWAVRCYHT